MLAAWQPLSLLDVIITPLWLLSPLSLLFITIINHQDLPRARPLASGL